jgi:N6-L-threonylcarbamoyladenine synthase
LFYLQGLPDDQPISKKDFAASYQEAIVDSLMSIFEKAVKETNVPTISGGGGVMANSRLREKLMIFAENENKDLLLPSPKLSTDNAAMICIAAKNNLITNDLGLEDIRLSSIIS